MSRIDLEFEDRQTRQRLSDERSINMLRFFDPEIDRGVVYPAFLKDDIGEYSGGYVVVLGQFPPYLENLQKVWRKDTKGDYILFWERVGNEK